MTTGIILIVISLFIILMAVRILLDVRRISNHGWEAKGIIFNLEQSVGTDNIISCPIVRFLTKEDNWITKPGKIGVIPGIYKKGKAVTVIYQNDNPNNFFIKNKLTFLIPITMLCIALALQGNRNR